MALLLFQFTDKGIYWACLFENLFILGLLFRICVPALLFDFLTDLSFC